jgi:hypothetical protein
MEIDSKPVLSEHDSGEVKPFVVVSSPGMHDIAQRVVETIQRKHSISLPHYPVSFERFKNGDQPNITPSHALKLTWQATPLMRRQPNCLST